jgi:hypothetical protein
MNSLTVQQANNLVEGLESVIEDVHTKSLSHSVVYIKKLDSYVSMQTTDAPWEYGWEVIAKVGE